MPCQQCRPTDFTIRAREAEGVGENLSENSSRPRNLPSKGRRMGRTGIATAARTAGAAVLAAAAALGMATGIAMGPAIQTAQAAPHSPNPPNSWGTLYGDPEAAAAFWRYQQYDDDCVPMAIADVVGQLTGNQPSEEAIIELAHSTRSITHSGPIYTIPEKRSHADGTSFNDEPVLLAHYGIQAVSTSKTGAQKTGVPTGMESLQQALAKGRKVIAGVNAEVIWGETVKDKNKDGDPEANHAVVVTGVDTARGLVHLNDSGSRKGEDEKVPIEIFVRSWDSSGQQMTITS
jgi:hypothetical protein